MDATRRIATPAGGWREEAVATASLAAPLVLAQLTQIAIYSTDVVMLGWLGPEALAASALGVNLFFMFNFTALGLVTAAAPLIAAALGAKKHAVRDVRRSVRSAIHAALLFCAFAWLVMWNAHAILLALGQDPTLSAEAAKFLRILQWTLLPNLLIIVLRTFLTAIGRPAPTLVVTILGLFVNAALNWMLVFGHWGAPALGLVGSACASLISTSLMALVLALYVALHRRSRRYYLFGRLHRFDSARLRAIFRIGTPIALTLAFEVSVFGFAVYLMGWIDTSSVAAHAIALQIASITFMVPLGLSQATVIRVGLAYGARDRQWVARAGWTSLAMAMLFMGAAALVIWTFPAELAGLFLDESDPGSAEVLRLCVSFLGIAALFQLFDGAQVIGASMLRGLQDTRVPMLYAAFGYWVAGLGSGYLLAFHAGWRGIGIWTGLALGLAVVSVLMVWRWSRRERLGLVRLA
ncbi:MATE family efflux transporter [Sphingomonas sinipercae]|uniref:Multidrug-efflux transporter n=1 Tax=Sphingomonas sinipercae TaxID=2714944 RepID=A0A6G7ZQ25_9SPHN|nr:MATE family efflux transporter [Sphingomonas sinipercae]QIL03043.1 MATE family efflux transporter [Sphingomonas sinipercae]